MERRTTINEQDEEYVNVLVSRKKVAWIADHYVLSDHAKVAMIRRDEKTEFDLRSRILASPLVWKTYDNRIAIALDLYSYIVIDTSTRSGEYEVPIVCTFVNTESAGVNVVDKMLVAYKEFCQQRRI